MRRNFWLTLTTPSIIADYRVKVLLLLWDYHSFVEVSTLFKTIWNTL
jgi:hypothetical protein